MEAQDRDVFDNGCVLGRDYLGALVFQRLPHDDGSLERKGRFQGTSMDGFAGLANQVTEALVKL